MGSWLEKQLNLRSGELWRLVVAILLLGFLFSFREWGVDSFNFRIGLANFALASILVAISFFVHELAHRWLADKYGAEVEYRLWPSGIIFSVLLTFLSNGYLIFAAPGTVAIYDKFHHLLGKEYPRIGPYTKAKIAAIGPLSNIFLAVLAKPLAVVHPVFQKLMIINLWLAVINMIPFLKFLFQIFDVAASKVFSRKRYLFVPLSYRIEGEHVFFGSRLLWLFSFTFIILVALLLLVASAATALIVATIVSVAIFLMYYYMFEYSRP